MVHHEVVHLFETGKGQTRRQTFGQLVTCALACNDLYDSAPDHDLTFYLALLNPHPYHKRLRTPLV